MTKGGNKRIDKRPRKGTNIGGKREGAGRPSDYTLELARHICDELINGKSMIKICEQKGMPHRLTVMRWLEEHAEFATMHARAREMQAEYMDDMILDTANGSTQDTCGADRVKIGAYQWRAERLMPKRFGLKVSKEISGPDGGPVRVDVGTMTDADLETLERILANAARSTTPDGEGGTG